MYCESERLQTILFDSCFDPIKSRHQFGQSEQAAQIPTEDYDVYQYKVIYTI